MLGFPLQFQSWPQAGPLPQSAIAGKRLYGSKISEVFVLSATRKRRRQQTSDAFKLANTSMAEGFLTVGVRANASCTSTLFLVIVQSNLRSMSSKS